MKGRPAWMWALLLGGLGYAGWQGWKQLFAEPTGTERLVNQLWIDRSARDGRDMIHHFVLIEKNGRRAGLTGRASRWRMHADVFLWGLDRNLLRMRFPQEEKRMAVRVRTWKCVNQVPRPFELCLELERDGRRARFYSRQEWVVKDDGAVPASEIGGVEAALEALHRAPIDDAGKLDEGPEAAPGLAPLSL